LISLKVRLPSTVQHKKYSFYASSAMIAIHVSSARIVSWIAAWLVALIVPPLSAQPSAEPPPGDYRVVDGRVDRGTYTGWRLFHSACYGCHGIDAVGTDLAPNLVERVKTLTPRAFATRVLTSYRIVLPANEANTEDRTAAREAMVDEIMRRERGSRGLIVMPAWETNPKVTPHVLDLYAYLSARADGKLGPGKPKLLIEKKH
jgi:hypothetical protein